MIINNFEETTKDKQTSFEINYIEILKRLFSVQNILVYGVAFLISMCGLRGIPSPESLIAPFGLAFLFASVSSGVPIIIVTISTIIGSLIGLGGHETLITSIIAAITLTLIAIKKPDKDIEASEKMKLSGYLILSSSIVKILELMITGFTIEKLLVSFGFVVILVLTYKVFANTISPISKVEEQKVFTKLELYGASLIVLFALDAFGIVKFGNFNLREALRLLFVLYVGLKCGPLVGTSVGFSCALIEIGFNLTSHMSILIYVAAGLLTGTIRKMIRSNFKFTPFVKALPAASGSLERGLNLNIKENVAYNKKEEIKIETAKDFETILFTKIAEHEDNFLYSDIVNNTGDIIEELYRELVKEGIITEKRFIELLESRNIFVMNSDDIEIRNSNEEALRDILNCINVSYRDSKKKKTGSNGLGVEELSNLRIQVGGEQLGIKEIVQKESFGQKIRQELEEAGITVTKVSAKMQANGRKEVLVETLACNDEKNCYLKQIGRVLSKNGDKFRGSILRCSRTEGNGNCSFRFIQDNRYKIETISLVRTADRGNESNRNKIYNETLSNLDYTLGINYGKEHDLAQIDLFDGSIIFEKTKEVPTFIKSKNSSNSSIKMLMNKDSLNDGDIIVMCSKALLDSNHSYAEEYKWIKILLSEIDTDNIERIANMILEEATMTHSGEQKEDYNVIVAKISKIIEK